MCVCCVFALQLLQVYIAIISGGKWPLLRSLAFASTVLALIFGVIKRGFALMVSRAMNKITAKVAPSDTMETGGVGDKYKKSGEEKTGEITEVVELQPPA